MSNRMGNVVLLGVLLGANVSLQAADEESRLELVDVQKVWDQAPHNAFTGLIRFKLNGRAKRVLIPTKQIRATPPAGQPLTRTAP